ncbi:unnamed protein product [Brugia timori]|uniref:Uncharacterized protein n=1 Tax=Brugia timori TaxID=42155 RepID=A0A0R3Q7D8_9BILA|nr:unnamed protein product [Brugia timori]
MLSIYKPQVVNICEMIVRKKMLKKWKQISQFTAGSLNISLHYSYYSCPMNFF